VFPGSAHDEDTDVGPYWVPTSAVKMVVRPRTTEPAVQQGAPIAAGANPAASTTLGAQADLEPTDRSKRRCRRHADDESVGLGTTVRSGDGVSVGGAGGRDQGGATCGITGGTSSSSSSGAASCGTSGGGGSGAASTLPPPDRCGVTGGASSSSSGAASCGTDGGAGSSGAASTLSPPERLALAAFDATRRVAAVTGVRQVLRAVDADLWPAVAAELLPAACLEKTSPPLNDVFTGKVELLARTHRAGAGLATPERNKRLLALGDIQYQFRSKHAAAFVDEQLDSPTVDARIEANRQLAGPGGGVHISRHQAPRACGPKSKGMQDQLTKIRAVDPALVAHASRSVHDLDVALGAGACKLTGLVQQRLVATVARVMQFEGGAGARDEEAAAWAERARNIEWGGGTDRAYRALLRSEGISESDAPLADVLFEMRRAWNGDLHGVREGGLSEALQLLSQCAAATGLDAVREQQVSEAAPKSRPPANDAFLDREPPLCHRKRSPTRWQARVALLLGYRSYSTTPVQFELYWCDGLARCVTPRAYRAPDAGRDRLTDCLHVRTKQAPRPRQEGQWQALRMGGDETS